MKLSVAQMQVLSANLNILKNVLGPLADGSEEKGLPEVLYHICQPCACPGYPKASDIALDIHAEALKLSTKSVAYNGNVYTRVWRSKFISLKFKAETYAIYL